MVTICFKSDGPKLKYMAEELYALPQTLLPCDPVDGSDIRYINHSHPSVHNPLKDVLDVMFYDNIHFRHLISPFPLSFTMTEILSGASTLPNPPRSLLSWNYMTNQTLFPLLLSLTLSRILL